MNLGWKFQVYGGYSKFITTTNTQTVSGLTEYGESYTTAVCAYKYINGKKVYGTPSNEIKVYRK